VIHEHRYARRRVVAAAVVTLVLSSLAVWASSLTYPHSLDRLLEVWALGAFVVTLYLAWDTIHEYGRL
jgi:hypothetical protein